VARGQSRLPNKFCPFPRLCLPHIWEGTELLLPGVSYYSSMPRSRKTLLASSLYLLALIAPAQTKAPSVPWKLEDTGTTAGLRGIHAGNGGVVWSSGTNGTVLRRDDNGKWHRCSAPPDAAKLDFRAIQAWDAQTALIMSSGTGDQSRLFQTTDGCKTWKLILTNPDATGFWDGLLFLDRQNAILYGDPVPASSGNSQIIPLQRTHNSGRTWNPGKPLQALPGESFFAASNSAMAAGNKQIWLGTSKGRVLRTANGEDWKAATTPLASGNDSSGVFSLAFRDQTHGVAVGGDYHHPEIATNTAAYTSDGGEHWIAAGKPPHGYRSAVAWDTKHQVWITAGTNGSDISYDGGKTWQWLDSGNWNALSLPWVSGPNGQIGKLGALPAAGGTVSR
jgi:photosystem II stability/assembly factor-like uncharacterized protein